MKRAFQAGCVIALALMASGAQAEINVTDDTGRTVRLARPAKRIVTLAPHMAETLYAAGAGARLVGTVDFSDSISPSSVSER